VTLTDTRLTFRLVTSASTANTSGGTSTPSPSINVAASRQPVRACAGGAERELTRPHDASFAVAAPA
jgi:hypothetical protein